MKTIRFWADTYSTGLINELGASISKEETPISENLWSEVQAWVEAYDDIIPMGKVERMANMDKIEELDRLGLELFDRVLSEWSKADQKLEEICFKYYSEGKLKFLRECTLGRCS